MKFGIAVLVLAGLVAGRALSGQAPPPATKPAQTQKPVDQSNPFPGDTNNVPLMPSGATPASGDVPASADVPANTAPASLPQGDADPVRSPDDPQPDMSDAQGFSSSSAGLDHVMPPPDTDVDAQRGRKGRGAAPAPEHQETAAEDVKVGDYYLDQKNWRAALSRYESALVLDPENPEVYWGVGEAERHLGKMAEAKSAYEKLVDYDPDSKHGKEAKKILKSPEMAAAPSASTKRP